MKRLYAALLSALAKPYVKEMIILGALLALILAASAPDSMHP